MDLHEYQIQARRTEKRVLSVGSDTVIPILGLAGEVGELLNEYKKHLRDGDARSRFLERMSEELGDILWYVSATATAFGLDLADVADRNLEKTRARWGVGQDGGEHTGATAHHFDLQFPEGERFPRHFIAEFHQRIEGESSRICVWVDGKQLGQDLTDNAYEPDGYRFHDVFHLACAAVLGWSPVSRRNLGLKRRSNPEVDEVEDGGRAIVTEEGISALVFAYAGGLSAFSGVHSVDYELLKAIRTMTARFEVAVCTTGEWERAIIMGYKVWKEVEANQGGKVELDLDRRNISYLGTDQAGARMQ